MALELNQRIFTWLSIYPLGVNASYKSKLLSLFFTGCILTFMLLSMVSSGLYILKHASIDFTGVLYAFFQFLCIMSTIYMTIAAYFLRPEIVKLIQRFRHIHRASKHNTNFFDPHFLMCI